MEETRRYVARRLQIAGRAGAPEIFPGATVSSIFRHSRGIPRLINTICENALLAGYARRAEMISPEMIEDVARDLRLGVVLQERGNGNAKEPTQSELLGAMKTLLDLHNRLQGGEKAPSPIAKRLTEHEPYI